MKTLSTCYIVLLTILLTSYSCQQNKDRNLDKTTSVRDYIIESQNAHYIELKSTFEPNLVDHFPDELDSNNIEISGGPIDKMNFRMLEVTNKLSGDGIKEEFLKNCIASYPASDQCVLSYYLLDAYKNSQQSRLEPCQVDKYPIPDFLYNKFADISNVSRLPDDFEIFILDSKPHREIPDSLVNSTEIFIEKWNSGFSKGVSISEERKVIIYWTIAWKES